eukprot:scaffold2367_cov122-Isochrysis_galbana.AAC.3
MARRFGLGADRRSEQQSLPSTSTENTEPPFFESLTTPRTTPLGSSSSANRLVRSTCLALGWLATSHAQMRNERAKKRATEPTGSAARCLRWK